MIYAMDRASATTLASRITESSLNATGRCATQLSSESGLQDPKFPYGACVDWGYRMDTITAWDDVATWGFEMFGLPGERYITDINVNDMTWWFRDEQDRLVFVLRNGLARCIQLESTT
jgi:hypothetical protein